MLPCMRQEKNVLLLGGTTEASAVANSLGAAGICGVFSYAGRTTSPVPQPLPTRIGGFGGVTGLVEYIRGQKISHLIDATHPFAVQMSRHAAQACADTGIPLLALERSPWSPQKGDHWVNVKDEIAALAALPSAPARVFLALGQSVAAFAARPEHFYLLRLIDPPAFPLCLPNLHIVLARGPFAFADDLALLLRHRIEIIIAKNSGGEGARAKLDAARALGLRVVMIERPTPPLRPVATSIQAVLAWLGHSARLGV